MQHVETGTQNRWTLTFHSQALEHAFAAHRREIVKHKARIFSAVAAAHSFFALNAAYQHWTWYPTIAGCFKDGSIQPNQMACFLAQAVANSAIALGIWSASVTRRIRLFTPHGAVYEAAIMGCALITLANFHLDPSTTGAVQLRGMDAWNHAFYLGVPLLAVLAGLHHLHCAVLIVLSIHVYVLHHATHEGHAHELVEAAAQTPLIQCLLPAMTILILSYTQHQLERKAFLVQWFSCSRSIEPVEETKVVITTPDVWVSPPPSPSYSCSLPQSMTTEEIMHTADKPKGRSLLGGSLQAARLATLAKVKQGNDGKVTPRPDEGERAMALKASLKAARFAAVFKAGAPASDVKPPTPRRDITRAKLNRQKTSASFLKSTKDDDFVENAKAIKRQIHELTRFTILPDGRYMKYWDVAIMAALFFTATVTPFEVAFMPLDATPVDTVSTTLFAVNRVVDSIFFVDIGTQFCVPFRQKETDGGRWVYNSRKIARHYFRGWFGLDVVTAVPVDLLLMASDASSAAARVLKVFKLMKLARLLRLQRVLARWLSRLRMDLSMLELVKFFFMTVFTAHWLACIWGLMGNNFSDNSPIDLDTWYIEDYHQLSWVQKAQMTDAQPLELYCVALYVALANIFGGPCEICPANYYEFLLQGMMMLWGNFLWAYVIGSGCNIIDTLFPYEEEHRRIISLLNNFVTERGVDEDLALRLRNFYNETNHLRYFEDREEELLTAMTPQLRGESAFASAKMIFAKVSYLGPEAEVDLDFRAKAALLLKTVVYCAREQISVEDLSIVVRGLVSCSGRVGVTSLGEDFMISTQALRDKTPGVALTTTQISSLASADLNELLVEYPITSVWFRKQAIRITFQRIVMRAAEAANLASKYEGIKLSLKEAFDLVQEEMHKQIGPQAFEMSNMEDRVERIDGKVDELSKSVNLKVERLEGAMSQMIKDLTEEVRAAHEFHMSRSVHRRANSSKLKSAPQTRKNIASPKVDPPVEDGRGNGAMSPVDRQDQKLDARDDAFEA